MREYEWPYVDWQKLLQYRANKVKHLMDEEKLDALLLTYFDNIRYTTDFWLIMNWVEGFYEGFAAIVEYSGNSYIFSSFQRPGEILNPELYDRPHIKEVIGIPGWYPLASIPYLLAEQLSKKLKKLNVKRVGIDNLHFETYELLKKELPFIEFKPVSWNLLKIRAVKHYDEIKLIEYNSAILDAAATEGMRTIRKGLITENQVIATITNRMYELGIEGLSHCSIVSSHSSPFLTYASHRPLVEGDTIWFDIGFYGKGGYATDMARTCFVGKPKESLFNAYRKFYDIYHNAIEIIKPGMKASALDSLLRNNIRKAGFIEYPHTSGHGLGLRVCELPILHSPEYMVEDMVIESGMVLNVEPMVQVSDVSFKIEDAILVTDTGFKLLNKADYGL